MMNMEVHLLPKVIQSLRCTTPPDEASVSDGQLLGQFIEHQDEYAFAALVRRHSPMVWGVCRRIVAHHQDAEDAFQAAFLVLARKAGSIRPREMVANWEINRGHPPRPVLAWAVGRSYTVRGGCYAADNSRGR